MPGPSAQSVKDILGAYHQKRATTEAVVRTLLAYRGWLAPLVWMAGWRPGWEATTAFGDVTRLPTGELWLFTGHDTAALAAAAGGQLGAYASDVPGGKIFRRLDGKWDVKVNVGSPVEHRWFFRHEASALLATWCDAVELEEALAQVPHPDPPSLMKRVLDYRWFLVLLRRSDDGLVTFTEAPRTEVAPLFTANDNLDAFLSRFSPAEKEQVHAVHVPAARVFEAARRDGRIGKVVINAFGPAPSREFSLG